MLASRFASDHPERVSRLVLVNGGPIDPFPGVVRAVLSSWPVRGLFRALVRALMFSPSALTRAFGDAARIPAAIRALFATKAPPGVEVVHDTMVLADAAPPAPAVPTLLLWGEADQMPVTNVAAARKLARAFPRAELKLLAGAGHLPQVEVPGAFVDALEAFSA
jgi:2-hydroxy-6-oxonona-2,4-dienedioate hydrolase